MRALALIPLVAVATPALAQTVTPIGDARLRYEWVDQKGIADEAEAATLRVRAGFEAKEGKFALLAESEATLALAEHYNSTVNGLTRYPIVADPQNIELNRLQLQYRGLPKTVVTLGRQRITIDDQRFVGNVGWRQNEQTFDAVRVQSSAFGPASLDLTYARAVRTIYGVDSGIAHIDGDNLFGVAGLKLGKRVTASGFAYLVDQDAPGRRQFSSQTYGGRAVAAFPLGRAKLGLTASYARQSDWRDNPVSYRADYWLAEGTLGFKALALNAGYEVLGAGTGGSFQTPLATLHKFQGWADKFLTTPADGIRDLYAGGTYTAKFGKLPVTAQAVWHRFDSDRAVRRYGQEWDLQLGVKPTKHFGAAVKYADYQAQSFATDTRKLWLQLEMTL